MEDKKKKINKEKDDIVTGRVIQNRIQNNSDKPKQKQKQAQELSVNIKMI